jgi:hypothetical protein
MTKAKGSFDFLRSECVVGTAFNVERTYFGGQLASGEGVTLDCQQGLATELEMTDNYLTDGGKDVLTFGGRMIGGGGRSSSETLKG